MMSIHEYIIDHKGFDWSNLLASWGWLLPRQLTVWIMNRFGDLFVVLDDGTVHMLDVGAGSFQKLANDRTEFSARVDEDDNASNWFMMPLVDQLTTSGQLLPAGHCYSYALPPVFGGQYTASNTIILPIAEHYGAYGSIHQQIKDLPLGSEVVIQCAPKDARTD